MEILVLILVVIVALVGFWYVSTYNGIKVAKLKVEEAFSGIDVALTKRYDVLKKMVDAIKGYQKHEKEVLFETVKLRAGMSVGELNEANSKMDALSEQIRIVSEAYPEIKANTNYLQLQDTICDVEEHLQAARRVYNSNVTSYNIKIVTFPSNIIAGRMGAREAEFFVAEDIKRKDISIDL